MGMSVSRCQEEVSSSDFAELIALNNKEPFLIDRSEYMLATLCAITANIHSKNRRFTYKDFLLKNETKVQSPMQIQKTLEALYGGN